MSYNGAAPCHPQSPEVSRRPQTEAEQPDQEEEDVQDVDIQHMVTVVSFDIIIMTSFDVNGD